MSRSSAGRGSFAASASTASRCDFVSFVHASTASACCARRHVPRISPSTSSAPGQTRGVHSSLRCFSLGTRSARSCVVVWSQ